TPFGRSQRGRCQGQGADARATPARMEQHARRLLERQVKIVIDSHWTLLSPRLRTTASRDELLRHVRALARACDERESDDAIAEARSAFVEALKSCGRSAAQALLCAGLVLSDLAVQGGRIRARSGAVEVRPPAEISDDPAAEKARIRRQELVKRDFQL